MLDFDRDPDLARGLLACETVLAVQIHQLRGKLAASLPSDALLGELQGLADSSAAARDYRATFGRLERDLDRKARADLAREISEMASRVGIPLTPGVPAKRRSKAIDERVRELVEGATSSEVGETPSQHISMEQPPSIRSSG